MSDHQPPAGGYPPPSPPAPPGPPSFPPPPSYPPSYPPPGAPWGPPGGPGRPASKGLGLWITLVVVGALALAGVVVALVLVLTDEAEGRDAAAEPTASVTTDGATATETPTDAAPSDGSDGSDTSGAPPAGSTADAVPNEPEAVVEALFRSIFAGDCATAEDLVTQDYIAGVGSCEATELPTELLEGVSWEIGETDVDEAAGTATVEVELAAAGQTQTATVDLVQQGGRWLVSSAE